MLLDVCVCVRVLLLVSYFYISFNTSYTQIVVVSNTLHGFLFVDRRFSGYVKHRYWAALAARIALWRLVHGRYTRLHTGRERMCLCWLFLFPFSSRFLTCPVLSSLMHIERTNISHEYHSTFFCSRILWYEKYAQAHKYRWLLFKLWCCLFSFFNGSTSLK